MILYLDVDVNPQNPEDQCNSYHIAQLLATVARKNPQVEVTLRIARSELNSTLASTGIVFPRVSKAVVSAYRDKPTGYRSDCWSFFLVGHIFPDLRQLETDCFPKRPTGLLTIDQRLAFAENVDCHKDSNHTQTDVSFGALGQLQELKIGGDTTFNKPLLLSLFGSAAVPTRLTTLEIVNCPKLLFAKNIETWTTLFQRSLTTLPALRKLKLHIPENPDTKPDIAFEPVGDVPQHFCDFVRVFGQNIQYLDLSLRFACRRMFLPPKPASSYTYTALGQRGAPADQREPLVTLPQRLIGQGSKYRRIIYWFEVCYEQHICDAMAACASAQGTEYSWEVVSDSEDKASWHVGMHEAIHFKASDVTEQPYLLR